MTDARPRFAELMRILAHENRLRILETLRSGGETAVSELERQTGIGQPGLSQQLAILRKGALVETRREAKQVYYRIAPEVLLELIGYLGGLSGRPDAERSATPAAVRGSTAVFAKILG